MPTRAPGRKAGFHKRGSRIGATGALTRWPPSSLNAASIGMHFDGILGGPPGTGGHCGGAQDGGQVLYPQRRTIAAPSIEDGEYGSRACRAAIAAFIQAAFRVRCVQSRTPTPTTWTIWRPVTVLRDQSRDGAIIEAVIQVARIAVGTIGEPTMRGPGQPVGRQPALLGSVGTSGRQRWRAASQLRSPCSASSRIKPQGPPTVLGRAPADRHSPLEAELTRSGLRTGACGSAAPSCKGQSGSDLAILGTLQPITPRNSSQAAASPTVVAAPA